MLLECKGICAGYTTSPVLFGVDLTIAAGEIVTLVGANGAGKSTLVKTISGLVKPMVGEMRFEGASITSLSTAARLALGICHVPEGRQVFAGMSVAENLGVGGYARRHDSTADRQARMDALFGQYPFLKDRMEDVGGNFSGGQQQILAIARGLMSAPRLIMLDEPSLGLSPMMVSEVFKLVTELRSRGHSILLSEQNARAALAIADRGYVIENGRVAMSGNASDLLASPEIAQRYLGIGIKSEAAPEHSLRAADRLRACIGAA